MVHQISKWEVSDLANAMANAITQCAHRRFLKQRGDTIKFNGFWRNGDKQNVCAWLNKASWHDAKTGDGGGCKEFAKVAFNMTLPEFMQRYGDAQFETVKTISSTKTKIETQDRSLNQIWQELCNRDTARRDFASEWLEQGRGINNPRSSIGSGFANLYPEDVELFDGKFHSMLKQRLTLGPNLIAPIRSIKSAQVENFFFRAMKPVTKEQKSRLIPGAGGFGDAQNIRAFGLPHLIHNFSHLMLCEGMADYFAMESILRGEDKYLALGIFNAASLSKWAEALIANKYQGKVIWVYQLDADDKGELSASGIGQLNATKASRLLRTAGVTSELFNWPKILKKIPQLEKIPGDLAELCGLVRTQPHVLTESFFTIY